MRLDHLLSKEFYLLLFFSLSTLMVGEGVGVGVAVCVTALFLIQRGGKTFRVSMVLVKAC